MKFPTRILLSAIALAIALPGAAFAAKGERKKKKKEDATAVTFEKADTNGDKSVSKEEYIKAMAGKLDEKSAGERFATLDKNGDGSLSAEEYNAGLNSEEPKKKKKKKNV